MMKKYNKLRVTMVTNKMVPVVYSRNHQNSIWDLHFDFNLLLFLILTMKIFWFFCIFCVFSKKRKLLKDLKILPLSLVLGGYYVTNKKGVNKMANNAYL